MAKDIEKRKPDTVLELLNKRSFAEGMEKALPRWITADRMLRVVLTEFRKTPALLSCSKASVLAAVMQTAQLGLEPGGALGHAWFIPFKDECTLVIGYKGLIDLARRSGQIVSISARVVYELDMFGYTYGLTERLEHVPADGERGEPKYVYGVANLTGGGHAFEVMTVAEVNAIRNRSRAYMNAEKKGKDSTWHNHWGEMARKTLVRRLFKYLPASVIPRQAHDALEGEDKAQYRQIDGEATVSAAELLSSGRHKLSAPKVEAVDEELQRERDALIAEVKALKVSTVDVDKALADTAGGKAIQNLSIGELRALRAELRKHHGKKNGAKRSAGK